MLTPITLPACLPACLLATFHFWILTQPPAPILSLWDFLLQTGSQSLADVTSAIDPSTVSTSVSSIVHDAVKIGDLHAQGLGSYTT